MFPDSMGKIIGGLMSKTITSRAVYASVVKLFLQSAYPALIITDGVRNQADPSFDMRLVAGVLHLALDEMFE